MPYKKSDFLAFSNDSQRISANPEPIDTAWLDTRRQMEMLPVSMCRAFKEGTAYLHVKAHSNDNGTSKGARSQQTETQFLKGMAVSVVAATLRGRAAPLFWLAGKPKRKADKKDKDRRQGTVLLDAARYFLQASHPLDIDFVLELPGELRLHFNQWCANAGFIPAQ